jgi:hypothetical protein
MKTKFFIIGFLSALAIFALSGGVFATREYSKYFSDVKDDQWYYSAVMELSEEGLINGYSDGTFGVGKNITREEAAKLFYLTNLRIAKLEGQIAELEGSTPNNESVDEEDEEVAETDEDSSEESEGTIDEEQIVLNVTVDLESESTMPAGYSLFEEDLKNFKVYVPSLYFWDNSIGESRKSEGYLWRTEFSLDDFATVEEAEVDFAISVVDPDLVESDSEVLIFVNRDADTKFLLEGKLAIMKDLQKIAASFKTIQ